MSIPIPDELPDGVEEHGDGVACSVCGATLPSSYILMVRHIQWHATAGVRKPFDLEPGAHLSVKPQYGIEFNDADASHDVYESLAEARESMETYYQEHIETPETNIDGMRVMQRTVTTILGPWVEHRVS